MNDLIEGNVNLTVTNANGTVQENQMENVPTFVMLQENNIVENLKNRFAAIVFHFDKINEDGVLNNRKSHVPKNKITKVSR